MEIGSEICPIELEKCPISAQKLEMSEKSFHKIMEQLYRSFSHDVTAAIFVQKTMNRRPCLCTKKILWELNSFHMLKLSFIPSNLQSC